MGQNSVRQALFRDGQELLGPRPFRSENRLFGRKDQSVFTVSGCDSRSTPFQPKHPMLTSHKDVKGFTSIQDARFSVMLGKSGGI